MLIEEFCMDAGGVWNPGLTCADNVCEIAPPDDCCLPKFADKCIEYGDVTDDGIANVVDVQCGILSALAGLTGGLFSEQPDCMKVPEENADLNCDGTVDITDVLLTIKMALGQQLDSGMDTNGDMCPDTCKVP